MLFPLNNKVLITFLAAALVFAPTVLPAAPAILVLGDSLSAAYGLDKDDGWVALLS